MGYKEDALDFLGITEWHKAGYTGKGIKILSHERVCENKHPDVISPEGFTKTSGHGDDVMSHLKLVAPDAEFIAYPFHGTFGGNTYKCECAEYIIENEVHIFTTSNLSAFTNQGKDKAMQDCIDKGCIFFSAGGNDGNKGVHGESKSEKYFAIGGVKPKYNTNDYYEWDNLKKTSYSSVGKELDFVTIAEIMNVTGTSFCAPVFAGMCGLVQQFFIEKVGRRLKRIELEMFIKDNLIDTDEEGFDIRTGHGLFVLPEPETINISDYAKDINVPIISEGIYYGGMPQVEDIKIKQMLLTPSEYTRPQTKIEPTAIAWHYVGNPNTTAIANRNYFESLKDSHKTKASSHYIIGLEGEIIQCIPDLEKSFCTNNANDYTISVECCHPDNTGRFTDETYRSMVWLGKYLMQKHGIKNNIRHYDVTGKACPKWFVDNPDEWEQFKDDLEVEEVLRYKTIEEMPEYYRKDIQELIDRGIIAGRGGEAGLDLSDDMCRMAIYAKKIFEIGAK
jgi:N-acetyl-anhydromuramyl-L-alanine amidase AmpD